MDLCLVMLGRFKVNEGYYLADQKNINAIERYLKYFDNINVVARNISNKPGLYNFHKVDTRNGRIKIKLYEEKNFYSVVTSYNKFKNILVESIISSDLVLCWAEPKSEIVVNLSKKYKKTCVVYVGGCNKDTLLSSKSLLKKSLAYPIYLSNKRAIKRSDYVHYVTKNQLQKRYPTKKMSIGASYVNIQLEIEGNKISERIDRYKNLDRKITIGLIGYLNEVKGIDTAIKSLSKLDERYILKILGGGDSLKYEKLADSLGLNSRVIFEGTVEPGTPVLDWLDKIDLYIQPSRTEGLPRATIEALSRGCPVISSTAMGLKELVKKEWMHKPGDSEKLAQLINEIMKENTRLTEIVEQNLKIASEYDRNKLDIEIDYFFKHIKNKIMEKNI